MNSTPICCGAATTASPRFLGILTFSCALFGLAGWGCARSGQSAATLLLFMASYAAGGYGPVREVWHALRQRQLDVNLLMILAALGAAVIGEWAEGCVLLFLFSLSGTLEKYTLERTARSIEALVELRPDTAVVVRNGQETRVPLDAIQPGDLVRVVPAERLGVDGRIVEGASALDESTLTGESMPVDKTVGDEVFAGTLNHRGTLLIQATRPSSESMLSKIVKLVGEARDEKTRTEKYVERWQMPYVAGVLALSIGGVLVSWLLLEHSFREAFYHGMVLLVAASPCAVVISAPAAVLAGITRAARGGVLFKGGAHLERLASIRALALDKTGTVTRGEPAVTQVWEAGQAKDRLLERAAAVEHRSEHALGHAVLREAARRGLPLAEATAFEAHVGLGVHALVNGIWVGVGREQLFESRGHPLPRAVLTRADEMRAQGQTALLVGCSDGLAGVIGIADTVRPEAADAFRRLRNLGIRHIAILTGDHENVGAAVAGQVKVDEARCGLRPGEKVAELRRLKESHGAVAYVGDGVNDAPALAVADLGIAMGGAGTDVALETADAVLMRDDLNGLAFACWLSRRTRTAIRRGLTLAFAVIAFLVASTLLNIAGVTASFPPLWITVLCHEGSTVLAIFSGLYVLVEPE